jgi:hypothetical protein
MFESLLFRPNFPTQPRRSFDFFTFPNDLITDNRSYYTEIQFYNYNSGIKLPRYDGPEVPADIIAKDLLNLVGDTAQVVSDRLTPSNYSGGEFFNGQGIQGSSLGMMKLPLPSRINDNLTFSWGQDSLMDISSSIISSAANMAQFSRNSVARGIGNFYGNFGNVLGTVAGGLGAVAGYSINPLFFQSFQHQNFREFQFQWLLAPRTRTESATIASMISLLKRAASPEKAFGTSFILKYPAIAMIKFYPNNLTGHPSDKTGGVILKPCIIQSVSVDHTATAGGPSFFKGPEGAPVMTAISIAVKELQLWYREDYMPMQSQVADSPEPLRNTSVSGRINPERAG